MLVSDYVEGRGFDEVKQLEQDERDIFGEIVFRFCFGSIYHLQHFNADTHPGNYLLMDDGRVAFLDFGMTKRLTPEQIQLEQRAVDAAGRDDPEALRDALHDLGFVSDPKKVDAERLMEHVKMVGGWYLEDGEVRITPERVMKMIEVTSDPRSDFYDLVRRESLPADELMGRRMETGLLAVLAQLRATANWHRIMREWVYGDPPSTVLGEVEWRYFERRGTRGRRDCGLGSSRLPGRLELPLRHLEQARIVRADPVHPHRQQFPHPLRVVDGPGDQLDTDLPCGLHQARRDDRVVGPDRVHAELRPPSSRGCRGSGGGSPRARLAAPDPPSRTGSSRGGSSGRSSRGGGRARACGA